MIRNALCYALGCVLCLTLLAGAARAEVTLAGVFGDHMVVQREVPIRVWGWAEPGEEVRVSFLGKTGKAVADAAGNWEVELPATEARAEGSALVVNGTNTIEIKDVLVGEVWLCSGQSNMVWPVDQKTKGKESFPLIRYMTVSNRTSGVALATLDGLTWTPDGPGGRFSGVGYHFGKRLHRELDVPVGLICAAASSTGIGHWIAPEGLALYPELERYAGQFDARKKACREDIRTYIAQVKTWIAGQERQLDAEKPALREPPVWPPFGRSVAQSLISVGYLGKINHLTRFPIRGVIWYQGESNAGTGAAEYTLWMKALVAGWRKAWSRKPEDFPFFYVQLAPIKSKRFEKGWPGIWEAQRKAMDVIPNSGMAVITDTVSDKDLTNVHPGGKHIVGQRLAQWALAATYGRKGLVPSGPLFESVKFEGAKAVVGFRYAEGLSTRDGKPPTLFHLAGDDRSFKPARARIEGETVVVESDDVPEPIALRFGWFSDARPNLVNGAGLPASPFRTDEWKGVFTPRPEKKHNALGGE